MLLFMCMNDLEEAIGCVLGMADGVFEIGDFGV